MARIAKYSRLRMAPAIGVALALVLSGCAAGQVSQTANQVAAIDGANGDVGQLAVRNVLFTGTDKVIAGTETLGYPAGSDLPVNLWLSNSSLAADTLTGISSPAAASVEISGEATVQAQSLLEVTGDSDVTVTLKGLVQDLPYGHSIPLTFTFATAGSVQVNVPIEIPTERIDTSSRETVNILPGEHGNIWFGEDGEEAAGTGEAGH